METTWRSPQIVVGPAATGYKYYHRPEIVDEIWSALENGSSVLITAPRRVGKTSILKYIEQNPRNGFITCFADIEGIDSGNRFYRSLFECLLNCMSNSKKMKTHASNFISKIGEFDLKGKIKMKETDLDYIEKTNKLISKLDKNFDNNVVLLIDELPNVLFQLHKNGKTNDAELILGNLRRWRQSCKKIRFVFAGSIGIHYVVQEISGRTSSLNDLKSINCSPLDINELPVYIEWATKNATVQYNDSMKQYLGGKIKYLTPYYINLMLDEVDLIAKKNNNKEISETDIGNAFEHVLETNHHFDDWIQRLVNYMTADDYSFANEILTHIAHCDKITIQEIYDKAVNHKKTGNYMNYINNLENDGYIVKLSDEYLFISPFLKAFWQRKNPNYNG